MHIHACTHACDGVGSVTHACTHACDGVGSVTHACMHACDGVGSVTHACTHAGDCVGSVEGVGSVEQYTVIASERFTAQTTLLQLLETRYSTHIQRTAIIHHCMHGLALAVKWIIYV